MPRKQSPQAQAKELKPKPDRSTRGAVKPAEAQAPPPLRLEWRDPEELAENPRNWRRHPEDQVAALSDVLDLAASRWSKLTSRSPILEATGQTFEEVGRERCVARGGP